MYALECALLTFSEALPSGKKHQNNTYKRVFRYVVVPELTSTLGHHSFLMDVVGALSHHIFLVNSLDHHVCLMSVPLSIVFFSSALWLTTVFLWKEEIYIVKIYVCFAARGNQKTCQMSKVLLWLSDCDAFIAFDFVKWFFLLYTLFIFLFLSHATRFLSYGSTYRSLYPIV